jgi:hypothetical protein
MATLQKDFLCHSVSKVITLSKTEGPETITMDEMLIETAIKAL